LFSYLNSDFATIYQEIDDKTLPQPFDRGREILLGFDPNPGGPVGFQTIECISTLEIILEIIREDMIQKFVNRMEKTDGIPNVVLIGILDLGFVGLNRRKNLLDFKLGLDHIGILGHLFLLVFMDGKVDSFLVSILRM